ncbi:MAG TPA: IclR family transcriptional regulator [Hyphomicrobiaceae bacterium]|nr:IclR family transcriptional regulator [Hyphomicrobiaceae bacterium]
MRNSTAEPISGHDKVPAVTKAVSIVRYLNRAGAGGASLNEIANGLEITKSHCHNILKALTHEGWLHYDGDRRCYALAHRLLADVSCLLARQSPSTLIHDELVRLSRATGIPCVLTRVERDGSFVAIDKAEEAAELIVSVPIGHRFPPDAPAQMRVRLAWMPKEQRRQELARWRPRAYTKTTIVKKKEAWAEIEATRRRGYSISRAEFSPGVMTLAVPIFDTFGDVQMVLQSPGLIDKVTRDEAKLAAEILRTGERLNAVFGVSSDPPPKLLTRQRAGTGR